MELPVILSDPTAAATLLRNYYTEPLRNGQVRSGARFDTWAGGGAAPAVANQITADDILAASFLSVEYSPKAVIGILETRKTEISALLQRIPVGLELADVTHDSYKSVLGEESPAWELWDLLRGKNDGGWGIGATKASKLLARKRPHLIPIWDSVVKAQTGLRDSSTQWSDLHELLTRDKAGFAAELDEIHRQAQLPHPVSRLRTLDVVLWMDGAGRGIAEPKRSEGEESQVGES